MIFHVPATQTLVIVNGVRLTEGIVQQLKQLEISTQSTVRYIISPGDGHHLFLANYEAHFPEAKIYVFAGRTMDEHPEKSNWNIIDLENPFPEFKEHNIHFYIFKGLRRPPPYDDRPKPDLYIYLEPSRTLYACDSIMYKSQATWFSRNILGHTPGSISFHPTKSLSIRNLEEAKNSALFVTQWDVWDFIGAHGDVLHGGSDTKEMLKKAYDFMNS